MSHKFTCGGCGCETFNILNTGDGRVVTRCTECKSLSVIQPKPAKLEIVWPSNAKEPVGVIGWKDGDGILAPSSL